MPAAQPDPLLEAGEGLAQLQVAPFQGLDGVFQAVEGLLEGRLAILGVGHGRSSGSTRSTRLINGPGQAGLDQVAGPDVAAERSGAASPSRKVRL